jgi:dTDP-4-amino-4,6-dideoxygalactose transaminase
VNATEAAEILFSNYLRRRHTFLVGRGTTAIYLALKTVAELRGTGEVIVPTVSCASVAQIVGFAGFSVVFADIDRDSFTLSPESVAAKLSPRTQAILPIHLYGYPANMAALEDLARPRGIFLIEDACHAFGGSLGERRLGSFGDFGLFSFGGTKALNLGGGGILTVDNDDLAKAVQRHAAELPPKPPADWFNLRSLSHRNLYHALVDLLRSDPLADVSASFKGVDSLFRDWLIYRWDIDDQTAGKLSRGLNALAGRNAERVARAAFYHEHLQRPELRHPRPEIWTNAGTVWRYTFVAEGEGQAASLTEHLRRHGIHASNHYWSLADLMHNDKSLPNTAWFNSRVINLWVDETADREYLEKTRAAVDSWPG